MKKFYIHSAHTVFIADYKDGQKEMTQFYELSSFIRASNWREAVKQYFEEDLYLKMKVEDCEIYENSLETSIMVTDDIYQPTQEQVEQWEEGKLTLYSCDISITVYEVNRVNLAEPITIKKS